MQAEVDVRNAQIQQQTSEIQGKDAEITRLRTELRVGINSATYNYISLSRLNNFNLYMYRIKLVPKMGGVQLQRNTHFRSVDLIVSHKTMRV